MRCIASQTHRVGRHPGFTLIELIVTISVLAILTALATPSFRSIMLNSRSASDANNLLSLIILARSEAVTRNRSVTLCKSADGNSCSTDASVGWHTGAVIFEDIDGAGDIDAGTDVVIRGEVPVSSSSTLQGNSPVANRMTFNPLGRVASLGAAGGSITVMPSGLDEYRRRIVIASTRGPRICKPDDDPSDCP